MKLLTCAACAAGNGTEPNFDRVTDKHALTLLSPERACCVEGHAADECQEELEGESSGFADEEFMSEKGVARNLPFPETQASQGDDADGQGSDNSSRSPFELVAAEG